MSRRAVVRLSGDLDARNTDRVAQKLRNGLRGSPANLEIDMSEVDRLAPVAAAAFFALAKAASGAETTVVVRGASPQVRAVMRRAGLDRLVDYEAGDGT